MMLGRKMNGAAIGRQQCVLRSVGPSTHDLQRQAQKPRKNREEIYVVFSVSRGGLQIWGQGMRNSSMWRCYIVQVRFTTEVNNYNNNNNNNNNNFPFERKNNKIQE
jgi:hypothetical protein